MTLAKKLRKIQKSKYGSALLPNYYTHWFFKPKALYLPEHGLAYVPIQKVANTSIRRTIRAHLGESEYVSLEGGSDRAYRVISLAETARLTGCFRFGLVRNPLDRLASCYTDKVARRSGSDLQLFKEYGPSIYPFVPHETFDPSMSFDEFVDAVCRIPDRFADRHFRSQHCFLHHRGRLAVDFVGRLETIDEAWQVVRSHVDLGELPRAKFTNKTDFRLMYTPRSARQAAARYATDIRLFGYEESLAELVG